MMSGALDGEDGAFASRLRDSAGTQAEARMLPEVIEVPSENDDFEGRRNWAALLIVGSVGLASASVVAGVAYWFNR